MKIIFAFILIALFAAEFSTKAINSACETRTLTGSQYCQKVSE